jgi:hypothetical protein
MVASSTSTSIPTDEASPARTPASIHGEALVHMPGGRGWYKNMIYAPVRLTGHGAKTLPRVREAKWLATRSRHADEVVARHSP